MTFLACARTRHVLPCGTIRLLKKSITSASIADVCDLYGGKKTTTPSAELGTSASNASGNRHCAQSSDSIVVSRQLTLARTFTFKQLRLARCFLGEESRRLPELGITRSPSNTHLPAEIDAAVITVAPASAAAITAAAVCTPVAEAVLSPFAAGSGTKASAVAAISTTATEDASWMPFTHPLRCRGSIVHSSRQLLAASFISGPGFSSTVTTPRQRPIGSLQQHCRRRSQAASVASETNETERLKRDFNPGNGGGDEHKVEALRGALTIKSTFLGRREERGDEACRLVFQLWRDATVLVEQPLRPCISVACFKQLLASSANCILAELDGELGARDGDREILKSLQECSILSLQHSLPIDNQARMHQLVLAGFSLRLTVDSEAERRLRLHEPVVSPLAKEAPGGSDEASDSQGEGSKESTKTAGAASIPFISQEEQNGVGVTDIPTVGTVLIVKVPRLPLRKLLLENSPAMPPSVLLEQLTASTTPFCYRLREATHAYVLQHNAHGDQRSTALMPEALSYALLVQQQLWVDQMLLLQGQVTALATSVAQKQEQKAVLDEEGKRISAAVPWLFFFFFGLQFALVFHLTYNVFSWDIVEPITYFIATAQVAAAYAYHAAFKRSLSPHTFLSTLLEKRKLRHYKRYGFSLAALEEEVKHLQRLRRRLTLVEMAYLSVCGSPGVPMTRGAYVQPRRADRYGRTRQH